MYEITKGRVQTAKKIVLYGVEGIGKTTFASKFPDPVFIDTEGGSKSFDVARLPSPTSWTMMLEEIKSVIANPTVCKTLVIDTLDWAEKLATKHICSSKGWDSIESPGYGTGYRYVYDEMGNLLNQLTDVVNAGINVVMNAHAAIRKFEQPDELGSYDRWELKLQVSPKCNVAAMVKEYSDMVLFANYKTYVVATDKEGKKNKASGGERVMYTSHHPCWDAKNRFGLPEELPFSFDQIAHLFDPPAAVPAPAVKTEIESIIDTQEAPAIMQRFIIPEGIPKALRDLMEQNEVDESEIRLAVSQRGYYPEDTPITNYDEGFIMGVIVGAWPQVFRMIQDNRDIPFN